MTPLYPKKYIQNIKFSNFFYDKINNFNLFIVKVEALQIGFRVTAPKRKTRENLFAKTDILTNSYTRKIRKFPFLRTSFMFYNIFLLISFITYQYLPLFWHPCIY